jgi:hypothetical protein
MAYSMNPTMSEAELQRLAQILQERGEGLAAINQGEADLLEAFGGAGQSLGGYGMGPGGGPIRSYQGGQNPYGTTTTYKKGDYNKPWTDNTDGGDGGGGTSFGEQGTGINKGKYYAGLSGFITAERWKEIYNSYPVGHTPPTKTVPPGQGVVGDLSLVTKKKKPAGDDGPENIKILDDGTILTKVTNPENGDVTIISSGGTNLSGIDNLDDAATVVTQQKKFKDSGGTTKPILPPPPKYKDKLGNEYDTKEEAEDADDEIDAERKDLKDNYFNALLTDDTWDVLKARGEIPTFDYLPESEVESAFKTKMTVATDEGRTEVPKMVELLTKYLQTTDPATGTYINFDKTYDQFIAQIIADNDGTLPINRLSEPTLRAMWEKAISKAMRKEAFELTPAEVAEFETAAPQIAASDNFLEWWDGQGGVNGLYKTEAEARAAWSGQQVTDTTAPTIGTIDDAIAPTVGTVDEPGEVTVDTITALTMDDIDSIGDLDDVAQYFLDRITGASTSPAQQQLKRTTEQNLKQLLGLQAGAAADPARIRGLRNMWMATQQEATGQAAELRSQETINAENALIEVYRVKGTMELQVELANLETRRQKAMKDAEFAQATELAIQQTALTRVITKATIDQNVALANLEARRIKAVEQGKLSLATNLANLQKDLAIAQVNANLSLQSKAMDQALAIAAYKGDMAAQELEVTIDLAQMQADLTTMGYTLQGEWETMKDNTKRYIAELAAAWNRENNKQKRDDTILASLISLAGTALGSYAVWAAPGSDIRMKKDIRSADSEVEGFLDALNAYQYQYKNPSKPYAEPGAFVGIMAQDLEKSSMGKSFVKDTPEGKVLNMNHGLAAILAGQANINERLRELENGSSR